MWSVVDTKGPSDDEVGRIKAFEISPVLYLWSESSNRVDGPDLNYYARENHYLEAHQYLHAAVGVDDEDPRHIDASTARDANRMLEVIRASDHLPPMILTHGGDAAVFHWEDEQCSRYLTISYGKIVLLVVNKASQEHRQFPPFPVIDALNVQRARSGVDEDSDTLAFLR